MGKKISKTVILTLSFFGVFFLGLLAHEAVHVIQSKSPSSICYDFRQNTLMHVSHLGYGDDFEEFRTYSEKWATIVGETFMVIIGFLLGLNYVAYYNLFKK